MRVVLVDVAGLGWTFLAERDPDESASSKGVRGWLARKRIGLLDELGKARGRLGSVLGQFWVRLQRLIAPDEHLLRQLRHAQTLVIDHAARMTSEEVSALWSDLLTRRIRKHAFWMTLDALLAIPSVLLAILPGPNLVGYWLAYRAIVHLLAMLGARSGRTIATTFVPRAELDAPVMSGDQERIERMAEHLEIPGFASLVAAYATRAETPR
jgi:hypothetical protein